MRRHLGDWVEPGDPGVVHQYGDRWVFGERGGQCGQVSFVLEIGDSCRSLDGEGLLQLGGKAVQALTTPGNEQQVIAALGKTSRINGTDAG